MLEIMEVHFTPDQKAFIRRAIESGRFTCEEDAVQQALSLWEERERTRAELLAALDEAETDLQAGRYNEYTDETLPKLADELRREGRVLRDRETC
jgi:putative addiction module CopG family antidote